MRSFEFVVKEEVGIHARPASQLVSSAATYASSIAIESNGKKADAKRLIALMALGVKCGDRVVVCINGEDEDLAVVQLQEFCTSNL